MASGLRLPGAYQATFNISNPSSDDDAHPSPPPPPPPPLLPHSYPATPSSETSITRPSFQLWQTSIDEEEEEEIDMRVYRENMRERAQVEDFQVPGYYEDVGNNHDSMESIRDADEKRRMSEEPYDGEGEEDLEMNGFLGDLFPHIQHEADEFFSDSYGVKAKFIGPYLMGDVMGEGSYAKVKEVLHSVTLARYAVKIFSPAKLKRIPNGIQNVKTEINILRLLHHRNICCLIETLRKPAKNKTYMVIELGVCCVSDLARNFPGNRLPVLKLHYYFLQLLRGLEYCHGRGVIHKDIKPSNLVVTTRDVLKIIDFGVAEQLVPFAEDDAIYSSQGSPAVQCPEVADGTESFSGEKLDVWSCGVTLFSLATGRFPFEEESVYELFTSIATNPHSIPEDFRKDEKDLCDVIDKCLTKREAQRPSINQLLFHPWIRRNNPTPKSSSLQTSINKRLNRSVHSFLPYIESIYHPSSRSSLGNAPSLLCPDGAHPCDKPICQVCHHLETASQLTGVCDISRVSTGERGLNGDMKSGTSSSPDVKQDCSSFPKWKLCRMS